MLHFIIGRAGSGKTYTARRIAAEMANTGDSRIMLIVPEQYSFESERALIERLDIAAAERVEVLSFTRLVNIVHRRVGGISGHVLDESGKAALMSLALEDVKDSLSLFKKQADLPELVPALLRLLSELKQASVSETDLHNILNAADNNMLKSKLHELEIIFGAYSAYLSRSYLDSEDCLEKLYNRVIDTQYFKGCDIIIDSFQHFTGQQYKIIEEMVRQANDVYITFCSDSLNPEEGSLFHCIKKPISRLMRFARENGIKIAAPVRLSEQRRFVSEDMRKLERGLFFQPGAFAAADTYVDEAADIFGEKSSNAVNCLAEAAEAGTGSYDAGDEHYLSDSAGVQALSFADVMRADIADGGMNETACGANQTEAGESGDLNSHQDGERNGAPESGEKCSVRIIAADNIYHEADYIAQEIRRLAREEGLRYGEIAVMVRSLDDYSGILSSALGRCEIPFFCDRNVKASSLPLFMAVRSLLSIAANKYSSDDVFAYLKSGLSGYSVSDISMLEQYTLVWGISGLKWLEEWTASPHGFDASGDFGAETERINSLRRDIVGSIEKFIRSYEGGSAEKICAALYSFLISTGADKRLRELCDDATADVHSRSWDALMDVLNRIAELFRDRNMTPSLMLKIYEVMTQNTELGEIPQHIDEVMISESERVRIDNVRVLFMAGVNDGEYPRASSGGILTDDDRLSISAMGIDIPAPQSDDSQEKLLFYSALCQASERVYITYRLTSLSSEAENASEYLEYVRDIFPKPYRAESELPQSADGALRMAAEKYREHSAASQSLKEYLRRYDSERYMKLVMAASPQSDKISRTAAGRLFGENMTLSSSKVETYAKCRFSYFCRYGLNARPLQRAKIDAMQRGTIVHFALEKMLEEHGTGLADMTLADIKAQSLELIEGYIRRAAGTQKLPASMDFMLENIGTLLAHALARIGEELKQSEFTPAACELKIGYDEGDVPPLEITLDGGGRASVVGVVDRADVFKREDRTYLRIVDYKTGKKTFDISDVLYGLNMQMLIYLFTLCENGGALGENIVPAGILYMPVNRKTVSGSKSDSIEKAEMEYEKQLKMNGLLTDDADVLKAMESNLAGRFIPASIIKSGDFSKRSSIAGAEEFELLERYVLGRIKDMGERLHSGDMSIAPRDDGSRKQNGDNAASVCAHCDYRSVCRIGEDTEIRTAKDMSGEDVRKAMEEAIESGNYPY